MEPELHPRWRSLGALVVLLLVGLAIAGRAVAQTESQPTLAFVENDNIVWQEPDHRRVNATDDEKRDRQPVISPDGRTIVFVRQFTTPYLSVDSLQDSELVRVNVDGSGLQVLTRNNLFESWPAWSPDGARLAFVADADNVYVMPVSGAGGGAPVQLTTGVSHVENVVWSPDGTRLAFNAQPNGEAGKIELYVLTVADGHLMRLTNNDVDDTDPTWSPDGTRLAYETDWGRHINLIAATGGPSIPLVTDEYGIDPAWSPDGALIAYGGWLGIHVIQPDGAGRQRVTSPLGPFTRAPNLQAFIDPAWTTDSRHLIYGQFDESCGMFGCFGHGGVWRVDLDSGRSDALLEVESDDISVWLPTGWSAVDDRLVYIDEDYYLYTRDISAASPGPIQQLTFDEPINSDPAWSPDGRWLVYSGRRVEDYNIHVSYVTSSQTNRRTLTTHPGNDWNPSWSLGGQIAFTSNRDGNWELYVMNSDGSDQTNLTQTPAIAEDDAAWSPSGAQLAFARQENGNWDIYVMNADGSDITRLTTHAANDRNPAWSPDGTRLAFQTDRDGNEEVYILTVAEPPGHEVNWTRDPADQREPTWSPDGTQIAFTWVTYGGSDTHSGSIVIMTLANRELSYPIETGLYSQPAWRPIVPDWTAHAWVPLVSR